MVRNGAQRCATVRNHAQPCATMRNGAQRLRKRVLVKYPQ
jgi:hypothetical protein